MMGEHTETSLRQTRANPAVGSLIIEGISKEIGSLNILRNISCTINFGERVLLLGANGAGKSTLLRICSGLMRASKGSVSVQTDTEKRAIKATELGYLGHQAMLYTHLTVRENLLLFAEIVGINAKQTIEFLARWGLESHAHKKPTELSKGLLARAALCRGLFHKPKLIFLDEPSSALDQQSAALLIEELQSLHAHHSGAMTVVLATHDLSRLKDFANRVIVLSEGQLVHDSSAQADRSVESSIDIYLKHNR